MRRRAVAFLPAVVLTAVIMSGITPGTVASDTGPARMPVRLAVAASAAQAAAPLPPGAVKHPGEACATRAQPPDGQACPQAQDTDCVGTNRQIGECMAARWGWFDGPGTGDEWACLDHRITDIENHDWSTTLYNRGGSGAYGIPQALPGSKMAGPNHVEVVGGGYRGAWPTDPYIQIAWLRVYVVDDYGTPCGIPTAGSY